MSGLEALGAVVGVVAVVAQIVSAYRDGGSIIDGIKRKRAIRRGLPISTSLEESVREAPDDIEREKRRGLSRFGEAFGQGDSQTIIALQQVVIQVQQNLLAKLRHAYDNDLDLLSLANDADEGRNRAIQVMIDLQQRLLTAPPAQHASLFDAQPLPWGAPGPSVRSSAGMAPLPMLPAAHDHQQRQIEDRSRVHSGSEAPVRDQRSARFGLFHRSRENNSRDPSTERPTRPSQASFTRVYTLPQESDTNISSSSSSPPRPDYSPPLPSYGNMQQQSSFPPSQRTQHSLPSQNLTPQSRPPQRTNSVMSNEPWHNPWADDTRSPSSPTNSPPVPSSSPPGRVYNIEPDRAMSLTMSQPTRTSTSYSGSSTQSIILQPNPLNNYLGFCKGAWKLQNGDTKAMVASRDYAQSAQSKTKIMRCSECNFEGHFRPDNVWSQVFKFDAIGMKIRWSFLAKCHVRQKYPQRRELARACEFTYQCIFCALMGISQPAIYGPKAYRDHISEKHHGVPLNEVVMYKAGAVDDRICDDQEQFDINLYPRRSSQLSGLSAGSGFA